MPDQLANTEAGRLRRAPASVLFPHPFHRRARRPAALYDRCLRSSRRGRQLNKELVREGEGGRRLSSERLVREWECGGRREWFGRFRTLFVEQEEEEESGGGDGGQQEGSPQQEQQRLAAAPPSPAANL